MVANICFPRRLGECCGYSASWEFLLDMGMEYGGWRREARRGRLEEGICRRGLDYNKRLDFKDVTCGKKHYYWGNCYERRWYLIFLKCLGVDDGNVILDRML